MEPPRVIPGTAWVASAYEDCSVVMITVLFSVVAHGVTAAPGARSYGRRMADAQFVQPDALEKEEVSEMPLRVEPRV